MNLVVDIGNTVAKLAVFQQDELLVKEVVDQNFISKVIADLFRQYPGITKVVVSNVSSAGFRLPEIPKQVKLLELSAATLLPFKNLYGTPETLGNDRKALTAAAAVQYPGRNVLVIDAGTCITYDFKNSHEEYLGGGISPGIRMRLLALKSFTANLPLVEAQGLPDLIGNSTVGSIRSGVVNGTLKEVEGIIHTYSHRYNNLMTIITGGDASFLSINLKNGIFANSNFLLEGLNYILEFNIDQ